MLCIHNTQTDPYFNLAAEEYLLKNFKENIFMLWQNEPSIVIGKHQDVWAEVNLKFVQDQQIKIARRFSGGGAVYHDPGNLNLTFIETGQIMQTDKYTIQIMNFLKTLGVHVEVDERKGLTIGGFKISGSAQSIHKNRYMHHATLLFSTDLDRLVTSLKSTSRQAPKKTGGKRSTFVKSVRSPVTISAPIFRLLSPSSILRKRFFTISRSIIPAYRIIPSRKQTWKPSIGLKSRNMLQPAGTLTLIHYNTETYLLDLCSYYIPFVETGHAPSPHYITVIKKSKYGYI